jgi:hypothetical protein
MQTKLYPNKKIAEQVARTLKVCNPDFSYIAGSATSKPAPQGADEGYFCIRCYLGKDFHSFA